MKTPLLAKVLLLAKNLLPVKALPLAKNLLLVKVLLPVKVLPLAKNLLPAKVPPLVKAPPLVKVPLLVAMSFTALSRVSWAAVKSSPPRLPQCAKPRLKASLSKLAPPNSYLVRV